MPGKRVRRLAPEYAGTDVHHLDLAEFAFLDVPVDRIFKIPGGAIQSPHTDMWMHRDSTCRQRARRWLCEVCRLV